MMSDLITTVLRYSPSGQLEEQVDIVLSPSQLHELYKTREQFGIVTDADLIGQSLIPNKKMLRYLIGKHESLRWRKLRGRTFVVMTYLPSGSDFLGAKDALMLFLYRKSTKEFIREIQIVTGCDARIGDFRELVGLPSRHSLIGEYRLRHDWQIRYLKNLGFNFDVALNNAFLGVVRLE